MIEFQRCQYALYSTDLRYLSNIGKHLLLVFLVPRVLAPHLLVRLLLDFSDQLDLMEASSQSM
jgi:hypothetical protein